jgi:hypothetical protein
MVKKHTAGFVPAVSFSGLKERIRNGRRAD